MNDLRERYIYAVVKNLPRASREDIKLELETLIDDMLEARCGEDAPMEKDLRVVLTELGTPSELFRKYSPDAGRVLIGEDYFPQYKRILGIVLTAAGCGTAVGYVIDVLMEGIGLLQAAGELIGTLITTLLAAFAAVTIVFAIMERKGVRAGLPSDTIENLPPVPKQGNKISRADCVSGIVLSLAFAVIFMGFPHLLIACFDGTVCLPIFQVQTLREGWVYIAVFSVVGVVRDVIRLAAGRRSVCLLIVTAACDLACILLACGIFLRGGVMNPEYLQAAAAALTGESAFVVNMLSNLNAALVAVIAVATLIDLIGEAVRTLRSVR